VTRASLLFNAPNRPSALTRVLTVPYDSSV